MKKLIFNEKNVNVFNEKNVNVKHISLIENNMINTYEVISNDLTKLEERLKGLGTEDVVELSNKGSYGCIENVLLQDVKRFGDEILDVDIKYGEPKEYEPLSATITAIVKKYPILYHVIFRENIKNCIEKLNTYLQENDYDTQIPKDTKVELIKSFMDGLEYHLVYSKSVSQTKGEIDFISSMDHSDQQVRLLNDLKQQYEQAQNNTKVLDALNQKLNYGKVLKNK